MSNDNLITGKSGEEAAAVFLAKQGYRILKRNYKTRSGEIDIIARDKNTVVFVEVKTRKFPVLADPRFAVSFTKQRQISKTAVSFLKKHNLLQQPARFDVVSLECGPDGRVSIRLDRNAFELAGNFTF